MVPPAACWRPHASGTAGWTLCECVWSRVRAVEKCVDAAKPTQTEAKENGTKRTKAG